jgi:hypothetical protein
MTDQHDPLVGESHAIGTSTRSEGRTSYGCHAGGVVRADALVKRDARGRFLIDQPGPRLDRGEHSEIVASGALLPDGAMRPAEREAAIRADLGDVAHIKAALITRFVNLELVATWLEGNLQAQGVLTARGRQRAALSSYVATVDRLLKVGVALGLERKPKQIDPLVAVRQAVEAANGR